MTPSLQCAQRRLATAIFAGLLYIGGTGSLFASNHLDTPTAIANPQADIGDLYAWIAPNARRLNLIMTIVGHSFSDRIKYVFHIDSGKRFGETTATTAIECSFSGASTTECHVGDDDHVRGDASRPNGLQGQNRRFRVFAGLRDDPFFNNVKGTRAAYQVAMTALRSGAAMDAAGCPSFDPATSQAIFHEWSHTDGGPASNFLAKWTTSALVISVDLDVVAKGGKMLAVWSATSSATRQINRMGRPLTGNALLGTVASKEESDRLKEEYVAVAPREAGRFIPEIEKGLAVYDAFDGKCGNQFLAKENASSARYHALAAVLADDRLWIDSASTICTQLFAVELTSLAGQTQYSEDCGGRSPNYNAANEWRSLLVDGSTTGVSDGLDHDDHVHSAEVFPFLAAPDPQGIQH